MNCSKIPPNDPKFVCPSPKVWDIDLKRLNWASVGRVLTVQNSVIFVEKLLNIKFIRTMLTNPPYLLLLCFAYPNRGRATAFNRVKVHFCYKISKLLQINATFRAEFVPLHRDRIYQFLSGRGIYLSAAASGWAGWALAHPEFGSSVNPITT